jgi:hypothetical protein
MTTLSLALYQALSVWTSSAWPSPLPSDPSVFYLSKTRSDAQTLPNGLHAARSDRHHRPPLRGLAHGYIVRVPPAPRHWHIQQTLPPALSLTTSVAAVCIQTLYGNTPSEQHAQQRYSRSSHHILCNLSLDRVISVSNRMGDSQVFCFCVHRNLVAFKLECVLPKWGYINRESHQLDAYIRAEHGANAEGFQSNMYWVMLIVSLLMAPAWR